MASYQQHSENTNGSDSPRRTQTFEQPNVATDSASSRASTARLVVDAGLDMDARRAFVTTASRTIEQFPTRIELDCSQLTTVDTPTIGMLVMIARQAQRRGQRVTLVEASSRVRGQLDDAGVSRLFGWSGRPPTSANR